MMNLSLSLAPPYQTRRQRQASSTPLPIFPACIPPEDGIDRLTALPDFLRLQILSLLFLPDAIRTSALSSPWKNLWKSRHPNQEHSTISLDIPSGVSPTRDLRSIPRLLLDPTKIYQSLHLSLLPRARHIPMLQQVLHDAAAYGVEDLSLDFRSTSESFRRPRIKFFLAPIFASLVRLSLSGFRLSVVPFYFKNLTNLEYLSFDGVNISETIFKMAVGNCSSLKSVDVRRCPDLGKVMVVGSKIANVTIIECPMVYEIFVRAPGLKKFHFKGEFASEYRFKGVGGLKDVYMCCDWPGTGDLLTNWVERMSDGLRHVTVLTLCSFSLQFLMAADATVIGRLQNFEFLKELQLLMFSFTLENLTDIYKFFKSCSCSSLERLFIELSTTMKDPYMINVMNVPMEEPQQSIILCLKTIKIKGYRHHEYEKRLVQFLLANTISLMSLIVVAPRENDTVLLRSMMGIHEFVLRLFLNDFLRIPKAAPNVEIVVRECDDPRVRPTHEAYCELE